MNTLEALYFPGTEIYSASQFPAFLLLGRIHLLKPVEETETDNNTADIFATAGLCQAHTPSPLGDQRERFLHLIKDIRERKDDYAAQLSSLTVASFSAKKSSVEDSSRSIVSTLLGSHKLASDEEDTRNTELWQARLLLKIGEQLDREEEEVAVQLALLDDDQEGLFKKLQGEMDDEEETLFGELRELKNRLNRPTSTTVIKRLKGWQKLFAEDQSIRQNLFITHMEDAADYLLEKYEEQLQLPAKEKITLTLPANIGWDRETALESILDFRKQNQETIEKIGHFLTDPSSDLDGQELAREWAETVEETFPSAQTGRVNLVFYSMATVSCAELLGAEADSSSDILGVVRWPE